MGLSRTVSKIYGDFSRKSLKKILTPSILRHRWKGSPWNWVPALGAKKVKVKVKVHTLDIAPLRGESPPQKRSGVARVLKGYRAEKEVWRYLQPSRYNPPMW